jgi:sodium-dependent phosphate cotransporter
MTVAPPVGLDADGIELPARIKALGWGGVAGLIYLLICAVGLISRGFAGLGSDAAHSMFAFAANPWVGLGVRVLTVLIQSSTTTRPSLSPRWDRARCPSAAPSPSFSARTSVRP